MKKLLTILGLLVLASCTAPAILGGPSVENNTRRCWDGSRCPNWRACPNFESAGHCGPPMMPRAYFPHDME